ncbi:MAG: hypothetical protein IJ064_05035 [Bacteroidaceae bacterium]|nr:hypothetical protein [Bacteroidaceae bacterium]
MNANRFINVARWNFAINRSQYTKLALSLFLVMSLPLLLFILKTIWVSAATGNAEYALTSFTGINMGSWMSACFLFAWPIFVGYTFHNLLTKQSRIQELTLPATNGEKFLFHALVTVVGSLLVYVVSYFLLDVLQYLYVGIIYGFSNAHWISYASIFFARGLGETPTNYFLGDAGGSVWLLLIMDLGLIAFLSTFVLGNAIKYKHNVLWTYLFHWVLGFASLLGLGLIMPVLLEMDIDIQHIDPDQLLLAIKWGALLFFALVIAFCWWMSYRLYTRAQITTLRNK